MPKDFLVYIQKIQKDFPDLIVTLKSYSTIIFTLKVSAELNS